MLHHERHTHSDPGAGSLENLQGGDPYVGYEVPGYANFNVHPHFCEPPGSDIMYASMALNLDYMLQMCTGVQSCAGFSFLSQDGIHVYRDMTIYVKHNCAILPETHQTECSPASAHGQKLSRDDLAAHGLHWYTFTRKPTCPPEMRGG